MGAGIREIRKRFEDLLKEKGHTEGFRVAMDLMMTDLSQEADAPEVAIETTGNTVKNEQTRPRRQAAIPFTK